MSTPKPAIAGLTDARSPRGLVAQRLLLLRQLTAAPRWALSAAIALMVIRALYPATLALVTGGLVGRLVRDGGSVGRVGFALGSYIGLLLAGQTVEVGIEPLRFLLVRRVDGAHRRTVERFACAPTGIGHLEDPGYRDDLLLAAGDPDNWTEGTPGPAVWAQLVLISRFLGGFLVIAVIARDSRVAAAFLLGSLLFFRSMQRRGFRTMIRTWADGMPRRRRAVYWSSLLTGARAAKEVRVFGLGGWLRQRYLADSEAHLRPFREAKLADVRRQWIWAVIVVGTMGLSIYVLGDRAVSGAISIGRLSTDLIAASQLLPMFSVSESVLDIEAGMPRLLALRRLRRQESRCVPRSPGDERLAGAAHMPLVRFEGVRFRYPNTGREVLDGLDLEIRPGEVLALVGLNGAGKSTIIKLLAALHEPDAGRLTVGGTDLREIGAVPWRRLVSVVFQDFVRYELPVRDNIALGSPRRVTDDDLRAAAAQAGITELIEGLPKKWDTPLARGDSGAVEPSGGQWQRIALARALLAMRAGARLLVLDEPTAHLDVRAELEVFSQVIRAAGDASVVLISHRLSTVRQADRIALIDAGQVAECGSHDALMALDGMYARLFRLQAEQFAAADLGPVPGGVT